MQANAVLKEYEKYSDQITLEYVDLLENPSLAYQYEDVQIGDIVVSCGTRSQTLDAYDLFTSATTIKKVVAPDSIRYFCRRVALCFSFFGDSCFALAES